MVAPLPMVILLEPLLAMLLVEISCVPSPASTPQELLPLVVICALLPTLMVLMPTLVELFARTTCAPSMEEKELAVVVRWALLPMLSVAELSLVRLIASADRPEVDTVRPSPRVTVALPFVRMASACHPVVVMFSVFPVRFHVELLAYRPWP